MACILILFTQFSTLFLTFNAKVCVRKIRKRKKTRRKRKDGRKIGLDRVLVEDGRRKAGVQSAVHDPQPDKIRNT